MDNKELKTKNRYSTLLNYSDFKIGNILFSLFLIKNKFNFENAIYDFKELLGVSKNFEIFENTKQIGFLCGILKNGVLLPNESSVVLTRSNDFIEKTSTGQCSMGDLMDRSAELSAKRAEQNDGVDPVKQKYFKKYSKERGGAKHFDDTTFESQ